MQHIQDGKVVVLCSAVHYMLLFIISLAAAGVLFCNNPLLQRHLGHSFEIH